MIRLTDTKQTFLHNWIVKRPSINDFPSHIKLLILIFYLPNIITESGRLIGIRTVDDHAMVLHKTCQPPILVGSSGWHQCVNEYLNIFEYFPPNIDICIQFVVFFKAEYYLKIQILCPSISEYWSLRKMRGNAGIKEVLFLFST